MADEKQHDQCPPASRSRRRNAATTRAQILAAARVAFTQESYDRIGVRDIAAAAGIDPALVIRYFGSKEGLFTEAIGNKLDLSWLFGGDLATLGERLATVLLGKKKSADEFDPLLALLRSAPGSVPGRLLREAVHDGFTKPLAAVLQGPQAELRAATAGSTLLGAMIMQAVIRSPVMHESSTEEVVAVLGRALQRSIDPP